jgi:hypothetical protein
MPVLEFPMSFSWGYNPADPFAVDHSLGGPQGLQRFAKSKTAFRPESSQLILSLQFQTREAITPNRFSSRVLSRHLISYHRLTFLTYLFRASLAKEELVGADGVWCEEDASRQTKRSYQLINFLIVTAPLEGYPPAHHEKVSTPSHEYRSCQ